MSKNNNNNTTLEDEVERLKKQGVNVGMFKNEGDATQVVRIALDTDFLSVSTAKQWGIIPKKPVIIQVCYYYNILPIAIIYYLF